MFGHSKLEKDPRVWSYGVEYMPVPLVSGFLTQRSTERGRTETEYGLNFTYHFGMPWDEQMKHSKVAELRTVSGSKHEFVDRENRIILEYRGKNSYRIECLGQVAANTFRFRLLNGFDEFMAGQTVHVAAAGAYLAESTKLESTHFFALDNLISMKAAHAASISKKYLTNEYGEFDIVLTGISGYIKIIVQVESLTQEFNLLTIFYNISINNNTTLVPINLPYELYNAKVISYRSYGGNLSILNNITLKNNNGVIDAHSVWKFGSGTLEITCDIGILTVNGFGA
jgi:hypothetical protein